MGDAPAGMNANGVGGWTDVAEEVPVAEHVDCGLIVQKYPVLLQRPPLFHRVEQ